MRKLVVVAMVVLTLMLTACTPGTVKSTGVVTGSADACVGLVLAGSTLSRVTVTLYSGQTVVASTTVKSGPSTGSRSGQGHTRSRPNRRPRAFNIAPRALWSGPVKASPLASRTTASSR
jgi:hypothetical protein